MTLILSRRPWSTTVAVTLPPSRKGVPIFTSSPSPTMSTWSSSTVAPFSASIFSTFITSPVVARYCLPPVLNTAYIGFQLRVETALQKGGNVSCFLRPGQPLSARHSTPIHLCQSFPKRVIVDGLDAPDPGLDKP